MVGISFFLLFSLLSAAIFFHLMSVKTFFLFVSSFHEPVHDPSQLERGPLLISLATCHSLTIIDGEISGDPLDLIMFNSIKWVSAILIIFFLCVL